MEEMVEIFSLMYTVQVGSCVLCSLVSYYAVQGFTEEEGQDRAKKIFNTLDKNRDGSLEEAEFIKELHCTTTLAC